jgi:hypothetical protein
MSTSDTADDRFFWGSLFPNGTKPALEALAIRLPVTVMGSWLACARSIAAALLEDGWDRSFI